jgi:putative restriction endonuclease
MSYSGDDLIKLTKLNCATNKAGFKRPHKPVMLLTVTLLAEAGEIGENKIFYSNRLLDIFRRLFLVARQESDQFTPHYPFYHLTSEGFWHLIPKAGMEERLKYYAPTKGVGELREILAWASLDPGLYLRLLDPQSRHEIQATLIQHYLVHVSEPMWTALKEETLIAAREKEILTDHPDRGDTLIDRVRSAAFRRVIRDLYDVRCAACGVRFFFEDIDLIDAAHLIPFSEGGDDRPQNGIALCKNHHWLMDHAILAPGPAKGNDYTRPIWHVGDGLDERIEEHLPLLKLKGQRVILPRGPSHAPARKGLDWRMEQMKKGDVRTDVDYAE